MLPRLEELFKIKSDADTEIKEIQENCKHEYYKLGYWSYRVGHMSPARICDACNSYLGACDYPSKEYDYVVANNGFFNGEPFKNAQEEIK
jgi:hypothetical protein